MLQLQALIFDVDGTLAETERDGHRVAFNRAFTEAGLDWEWSVTIYGELLEIAGGKERIQFFWQQYCPDFVPSLPVGLSHQDWVAGLHRAKTSCYGQILQTGGITLRPGVKRLLLEARDQGIRLAIATTSALDNVIALLETALDPDSPTWFEVIAAGDIVPAKKPAPDIYLYALQQMQLEPQFCVAIEDSYAGLQAARQAGLTTVITTNDYTRSQDFTGAAIVLDHLGEPDLPFNVLQGSAGDLSYFDLALANQLLASLHR